MAHSKKEPESEKDFSSDVRVLAAIYEYTKVRKENIWSPTIVDHFEGKLSVDAIFAALMRLRESAIIGTRWGEVSGKEGTVICIFIKKGHGNIPYAKNFYEMIQKVKMNNN